MINLCDEIIKIDSELELIKNKAKEIRTECEELLSNNSEEDDTLEESSNVEAENKETSTTENKEEVKGAKVYSKSEVHSILQQQNKGGIYSDEQVYINGELCYEGEISWGMGAATRVRNFYVGSETLNIYNYDYEVKGTVYSEMINFDSEF